MQHLIKKESIDPKIINQKLKISPTKKIKKQTKQEDK